VSWVHEQTPNLGFPVWFLAHDQREPFRDFLPSSPVCKSFFQSALGFSMAQRALRCVLRFSSPPEDTSSVMLIFFMRVLSLFLHQDGHDSILPIAVSGNN
jgi:hypothetical protein